MSFYRKYRPQKFAAVIGEDHVRDTLLTAISEGRVAHGYLFAGPRGIGKTTVARLLAKAINCQKREELNKKSSGEPCDECDFCKEIKIGKNLDIIEIDAASNRGIDEIRELREKVKFAPASGRYKVYIIDEVHMLTLPAFNALLKTLEEPPAHAIFILATTEAHKVPATILSRVQRFDFHRITKDDIIKNLKLITKNEKLEVEEKALEAIAVAAEGSHRDAISLLEQVASLTPNITFLDVRTVLGMAKSEEILYIAELIAESDSKKAINKVEELAAQGVESAQIIKELTEVFRQLLLVKITADNSAFEATAEQKSKLKNLAEKFSPPTINKILGVIISAGQLVKETSIRSLPVEMAIVEACGLVEDTRYKIPLDSARGKQETNKLEENPKSKAQMSNEIQSSNVKEVKTEESKSPVAEDRPKEKIDEKLWKEILEKIKPHNHSLNALLRDAYPGEIKDDKFIFSVKFKFHHDKISEAKNCQIIEKVLEEMFGRKLKVICRIADKKTAPTLRSESRRPNLASGVGKHQEENLEKAAKEIFEVESN